MRYQLLVSVVLLAAVGTACTERPEQTLEQAKGPPPVDRVDRVNTAGHTDAGNKTEEQPNKISVDLGGNVKMKFVLILAGKFMMGSRDSPEQVALVFDFYYVGARASSFENEHPIHRVRITRPFYLGVYEVTVGQFRQFVTATGYKTDAEKDGKGAWGIDPSTGELEQKPKYTWRSLGFPQTDDHPVGNVSWNDAVAFCEWLSRNEGKSYRLPTEAEREYACRAGTDTRYYNGNDPERLAEVGNVLDSTLHEKFPNWVSPWRSSQAIRGDDGYVFSAPVGRFRPNAFGLYDMHGNVCEWCADWLDRDREYYAASPLDDPVGPSSGQRRVLRGGSWESNVAECRSADREGVMPYWGRCDLGFRVVLVPAE